MRFLEVAMSLAIIEFNAQLGPIERKIGHMTREQSQRAAELEGTVVRLRRRERRLRAALKSPFVRVESRHDAREELESLLSETEQIEDELLADSAPKIDTEVGDPFRFQPDAGATQPPHGHSIGSYILTLDFANPTLTNFEPRVYERRVER